MANNTLSTITMPSGTQYDIVDAGARQLIEELERYTDFLGVTTTALSDGATTNPINIVGTADPVTAKKGNTVTYGSKEFIFNGTAWAEYGDLSGLGSLAYENSVEASYTPAGTVSKPTASVDGSGTTVVNSIDDVGTLPSATMPTFTVNGTNLIITAGSFSAGTLPTKGADTTVLTSVGNISVSQPTFTGTAATITSGPAD